MSLSQLWVSFWTIFKKEVVRVVRIWKQTILPPVITQGLYFIVFGSFLGSQIAEIKGISYMQYIVPGLVMMSVINASFSNTVSSFFGAKFQKSIEELLVSPTPNWVIIAGYVAGGVFRGFLTGGIVFGISLFFARPTIENPWIILLFIFLTSILFSLAGLINSVFAKKFDDISVFSTFILTPLTYLGGVFYSIERLPNVWQQVSRFNPILYMIDGFRYGFYEINDVSLSFSLSVLISLTIIFTGVVAFLLNKGVGMRS